jgi:hypothetical protein
MVSSLTGNAASPTPSATTPGSANVSAVNSNAPNLNNSGARASLEQHAAQSQVTPGQRSTRHGGGDERESESKDGTASASGSAKRLTSFAPNSSSVATPTSSNVVSGEAEGTPMKSALRSAMTKTTPLPASGAMYAFDAAVLVSFFFFHCLFCCLLSGLFLIFSPHSLTCQ